jgi:hypothetical protein
LRDIEKKMRLKSPFLPMEPQILQSAMFTSAEVHQWVPLLTAATPPQFILISLLLQIPMRWVKLPYNIYLHSLDECNKISKPF